MKNIINLILIVFLSFTASVFAHGDGHGEMTEARAQSIAHAVTKAMTFKDRGYSVGKIDVSWAKVKRQAFKIVEENRHEIIVKATNAANKQTLFIKLNHSGSVIDVKEEGEFAVSHGHDH